jgi:hypothetical protein
MTIQIFYCERFLPLALGTVDSPFKCYSRFTSEPALDLIVEADSDIMSNLPITCVEPGL